MINPSKRHLWLPVLALGMTLAVATSARAQDHSYSTSSGTSATLRVSFGSTRHWVGIGGTRIEELPSAERPNYDMFRYGGTYYAYNNNRWYRSPNETGDFTVIDDRTVPSEFSTIPREHWHNYPSTWQDRNDQGSGGSYATLQVNLGNSPHWSGIQGTRIEELPPTERPNYDMFRYDGTYYVYNNDRWYMSRNGNGEFTAMDDRSVPTEFSNIPRTHWHNYPSGWRDRRGQASATIQVNIGRYPRWTSVRGTRVRVIRGPGRPDFDLFRYNGAYYAYSDERWYMSYRPYGEFAMMDDRNVPRELSRVPRQHWRNYPSAWSDENDNSRSDRGGYRR
jgi:hypothetical protein